MTAVARAVVAITVGCLVAAACGPDDLPLRRAPTGLLTGRALLADDATLPAYPDQDLIRTPLQTPAPRAAPAECAAARDTARHPVTLGTGRELAGIVIGAADFTHLWERKPLTHTVAIEHCRLQPTTIAAMAGDTLHLENRDDFAFEPMLGPAFRTKRLRRGHPEEIVLAGGSVDAIQCPRTAPCGRTDVVVFRHPVFTVTDARGAFRIEHFPAGEMVRVGAWHPLFEFAETFVWVDPEKSARVDLVLRPKDRFVGR